MLRFCSHLRTGLWLVADIAFTSMQDILWSTGRGTLEDSNSSVLIRYFARPIVHGIWTEDLIECNIDSFPLVSFNLATSRMKNCANSSVVVGCGEPRS